MLRNGGAALAQARADFVTVKRAPPGRRGATLMAALHAYRRTRRCALGARSARCCDAGDVVVLAGELGVGKTVFAKGIAARAGRRPSRW